VVRLYPNGLARTYRQRVFQILDESGAKDQRVQEVRYTPSDQEVEIKAARVFKKSGEIVEAASRSDRSLSEPWYGLYYDVRAEVIDFGGLDPGDIVELSYVVADVATRNRFSDYFGD